MENNIQKILASGALAPSGGNSQPWQFRVQGNSVDVIALPQKDHPILNFRHRGTWVAHGALLENILIASRALGYAVDYRVFPDPQQPNLTIRMKFEPSAIAVSPLFAAIHLRATNRKKYRSAPLTETQKKELFRAGQSISSAAEARWVEDPAALYALGEAASINEIVTLENKTLHKLFMHEIVWTQQEEQERGGGLLLKTMELKPPQGFALKNLFSYWPIMHFFNKIGMARMIARDNAKIYAQAAGMGAIVTQDTDLAFFEAGRLMERIWLQATRMDLGFQLMTGTLFLHQRLQAGNFSELSEAPANLIHHSYDTIARTFAAADRSVALLFRVGEADAPSSFSYKKPPIFIS